MSLEQLIGIIALTIVLILGVVYFFVRNRNIKFKSLKEELLIAESSKISVTLDKTSQKQDELKKNQKEVFQEFTKRKSDLIKRNVPTHAKITKQQFREFSGVRILVAEDNVINQKVIAGLLAESGIELVMASDGQEALDILQKDRDFLMILMDAHMPRVDGLEASRIIRANELCNDIVIVALSGDTAPDDIKKMSEAGMQEHLEKPLRMNSLYDVLYAYSGPQYEKEKEEGDYIEVPMSKVLYRDKGLAICGGDEAFYFEILREFVTTYEDSPQKIRKYIHNTQIETAEQLLLDVIGVSANIGAKHFTKIATSLRDSLKEKHEGSYFTALEEYQMHLKRLIEDIKTFSEE